MKKFLWSFFEVFEVVIFALVIVVLIRAFIAQPFLVSGSSMEPSFRHGDYLLVDQFSYKVREPERGEVVVFKNPSDGGSFYIKRIIGLPGEELIIEEGNVFVAGEGERVEIAEDYIINNRLIDYYEVKLNGDEYLVLGDNRSFSFDSRNWGALKKDNIVGLARLRLWPVSRAMAIEAPAY